MPTPSEQNGASREQREYVLGTNEAEIARLGLQHRLWYAYAYALWERAGIGPGMTVLDAGCGPGFATQDLAALVGPKGKIIAVDESQRYLDHIQATLAASRTSALVAPIETRLGDVQALDIAGGSVDAAYCRWVLCFVQRPEDVVRGIARALRPGGVFAIQEYFAYESLTLAPRSAVFDRVIRATAASWRDRGGDPDIAGRLPALLERHGFEVREIKAHTRVARPHELLWRWPESFWSIFTPRLVELGYLSEQESRAMSEEWAARSRDPASFAVCPTVYDIAAVKR